MSIEKPRDVRVGDVGYSIEEITNLARKNKSASVLDERCDELGLKLGIELADLKKLKQKAPVDLFSEILLLFVSQISEEATLRKLCEGLRACRLNDIAKSIEDTFLLDSLPGTSTNCLVDLAPVVGNNDTEISALNSRENNALLEGVQRTDKTSSASITVLDKDRLKIQCIQNNLCYLLLIMTIAVLIVTSILLIFVADKYLVKVDGSSIQSVPTQASCLINSNKLAQDCITISASSHREYSILMRNIPVEKCVYLYVDGYSSKNWPSNLELPNIACIYGTYITGPISQSGLEYFLGKAKMVTNLSFDCQNNKFEQGQMDFPINSAKDKIMLKSLSLNDCHLSNTLEYIQSFANLVELTHLKIQNVSLTFKNVMEINRLFTQGVFLQDVHIHAVNFEAYETEIKLATRLNSLNSFVLDIESPHKYYDIQPVYLNNFCEMAKNVSMLKLSLGYFTYDIIYHLNECTKLKVLEVNVLLGPDDVDHLAIDFHHHQLEKVELNLYFYNCPNYDRFQELCLEISHQCALKSCTISSNCPVNENGSVFSLSCYVNTQ